jgi:hypothetical protein
MPDEAHDLDPHGLLASGEPLGTIPELREESGISGTILRMLFGLAFCPRPGATGPIVRCVRSPALSGIPWRYSLADARAVIDLCRPEIVARGQRTDERQAHEQAARVAQVASKKKKARKSAKATSEKPAPSTSAPLVPAPAPHPAGPEVIVRRRRPT